MTRRGIAFVLMSWIFVSGCGEEAPVPQPPSPEQKAPSGKPVSTTPAGAPAVTEADASLQSGLESYSYRPAGRRDPFRSLLIRERKVKGTTPLQQRGLGEINLVGIVWEGTGYAAMVETPDGKGYSIRVGTLVGLSGGRVKKITGNSVVIEEAYTDSNGVRRSKETMIELRTKEEELE